MELVTDADKAAEFVSGIIPKGMAEEAAKVTRADLVVVEEPKTVTRAELDTMSIEDLKAATNRIAAGELTIVE